MTDSDRGVIGGRYQVIASLGKGGMGQVYKAYDPILDRTVALKKMIATVVDSEEGRQRFYIEARAAARLNHPNIVTIHELEEYGGDIYIVMELLDGVSLAAFMKQRVHMPLEGYLTIIAQVADGLHYAHKRAIVHRDIKPPNLVLTTTGNLKILDFGIARLASNEITRKGKLLGTPHYMAPEQVKEESVDARADLFSLGAVAYELVTGIKPFTGESVPALLMQITSTPHRPVLEVAPETEPALAAIIDRLLSKDREQRFGTGMELCAALDLIGEIDRIDYVAEGVAAVMGPSGEATIYAPIGSTPISVGTPTPPGQSTPPAPPADLPPPFGATPSIPAGAPLTTMPSDDITPPFGVTPSAMPPPVSVVSPASVSFMSVTPKVVPLPKTSPEDATLSLSAPARVPPPAEPPAAPAASAPVAPAASTLPPSAPPPMPPAPAAPHAPRADASASPDAPTLVDVLASTKPDASPRSATLDTRIGPPASPPLPSPREPAIASSPAASTKQPGAAPPILPPAPPGAAAASSVTPPSVPVPPGPPAAGAMPSHAATASPNVPPSGATRAATPPQVPAPAPPASAPRGFVNPGVPQARHRSGLGAAVIVIGLLLLPAVVALGWWGFNSMRGALQRGTTATDTTSPSAVKDAQKPADQQAATTDQPNQASQAKPGETPAQTPGQEQPPPPAVDANAATPTSTEKPQPPDSQPPTRPLDANPTQTANASQTSPSNPPANRAPVNQTPANQANATQTPPPVANRTTQPAQTPANQVTDARRTPPPANQANANTTPADANRTSTSLAPREPRNVEPPRDAVTDRTREVSPETVVRDPSRENTRRGEPQPPQRDTTADNTRRDPTPPARGEEPSRDPSTPADTRSLDYGSLSAFRGGSRGTGSASNVYSDSPSTAAAVARITYTLDAYGDAIAARDLDALRDVRSPITPAEAGMLKEGRLTVRFSNLDVSLDGNDARVRCRRAVVANGKTLSSGPADVRLTRRPEGWVITDIR